MNYKLIPSYNSSKNKFGYAAVTTAIIFFQVLVHHTTVFHTHIPWTVHENLGQQAYKC